jgi:hypothetical protein
MKPYNTVQMYSIQELSLVPLIPALSSMQTMVIDRLVV